MAMHHRSHRPSPNPFTGRRLPAGSPYRDSGDGGGRGRNGGGRSIGAVGNMTRKALLLVASFVVFFYALSGGRVDDGGTGTGTGAGAEGPYGGSYGKNNNGADRNGKGATGSKSPLLEDVQQRDNIRLGGAGASDYDRDSFKTDRYDGGDGAGGSFRDGGTAGGGGGGFNGDRSAGSNDSRDGGVGGGSRYDPSNRWNERGGSGGDGDVAHGDENLGFGNGDAFGDETGLHDNSGGGDADPGDSMDRGWNGNTNDAENFGIDGGPASPSRDETGYGGGGGGGDRFPDEGGQSPDAGDRSRGGVDQSRSRRGRADDLDLFGRAANGDGSGGLGSFGSPDDAGGAAARGYDRRDDYGNDNGEDPFRNNDRRDGASGGGRGGEGAGGGGLSMEDALLRDKERRDASTDNGNAGGSEDSTDGLHKHRDQMAIPIGLEGGRGSDDGPAGSDGAGGFGRGPDTVLIGAESNSNDPLSGGGVGGSFGGGSDDGAHRQRDQMAIPIGLVGGGGSDDGASGGGGLRRSRSDPAPAAAVPVGDSKDDDDDDDSKNSKGSEDAGRKYLRRSGNSDAAAKDHSKGAETKYANNSPDIANGDSGTEDASLAGEEGDVGKKTGGEGHSAYVSAEIGATSVGKGNEAASAATDECADDPEFLYKERPGQDCAYVGRNTPQKCAKELPGGDGTIGVASCPVSCGMVEECQAARAATKKEASYRSKGLSDAASSVGNGDNAGAALKDDSVAYEAGGASSAKDVIVPSCEDDPDFLYKDKPGFDCAFVGKYKPDKCAKKPRDGALAIGVASCPVSCGMVEECRTSSLSKGNVAAEDPVGKSVAKNLEKSEDPDEERASSVVHDFGEQADASAKRDGDAVDATEDGSGDVARRKKIGSKVRDVDDVWNRIEKGEDITRMDLMPSSKDESSVVRKDKGTGASSVKEGVAADSSVLDEEGAASKEVGDSAKKSDVTEESSDVEKGVVSGEEFSVVRSNIEEVGASIKKSDATEDSSDATKAVVSEEGSSSIHNNIEEVGASIKKSDATEDSGDTTKAVVSEEEFSGVRNIEEVGASVKKGDATEDSGDAKGVVSEEESSGIRNIGEVGASVKQSDATEDPGDAEKGVVSKEESYGVRSNMEEAGASVKQSDATENSGDAEKGVVSEEESSGVRNIEEVGASAKRSDATEDSGGDTEKGAESPAEEAKEYPGDSGDGDAASKDSGDRLDRKNRPSDDDDDGGESSAGQTKRRDGGADASKESVIASAVEGVAASAEDDGKGQPGTDRTQRRGEKSQQEQTDGSPDASKESNIAEAIEGDAASAGDSKGGGAGSNEANGTDKEVKKSGLLGKLLTQRKKDDAGKSAKEDGEGKEPGEVVNDSSGEKPSSADPKQEDDEAEGKELKNAKSIEIEAPANSGDSKGEEPIPDEENGEAERKKSGILGKLIKKKRKDGHDAEEPETESVEGKKEPDGLAADSDKSPADEKMKGGLLDKFRKKKTGDGEDTVAEAASAEEERKNSGDAAAAGGKGPYSVGKGDEKQVSDSSVKGSVNERSAAAEETIKKEDGGDAEPKKSNDTEDAQAERSTGGKRSDAGSEKADDEVEKKSGMLSKLRKKKKAEPHEGESAKKSDRKKNSGNKIEDDSNNVSSDEVTAES